MSQPIKITEAELAEFRMLQQKFQDIVYKMGLLQIDKMVLDQAVSDFVEKEKSIKEEWHSIQKLEGTLLDTFINKYGEGGLNPTTGEYTPSTSTPTDVKK